MPQKPENVGSPSADINFRQRLLDELQQAEPVDLFGIVRPGGISLCRSKDGEDWTFSLTLEAWKHSGGVIQKRELRLVKFVAEWEGHFLMGRVEPYDVTHIRARIADDQTGDAPQGLLVGIIGKYIRDEELNKLSEELYPITIVDDRFGELTLDRAMHCYEAEIPWGTVSIQLRIAHDGGGRMQPALAVARALWDAQVSWDKKIRDYAASELLSLKNEFWLNDDEHEVSTEEFQSRMTLQSISAAPDGSFKFWYDDGDLFCGHLILISGNLAVGLTEASFHG